MEARTRMLAAIDRTADARARIYGRELDAMLDVAEAIGLDTVPVAAVRAVVDRMLDRGLLTAVARPDFGVGNGQPQKERE